MSNTSMQCPKCGHANRAGARFCIHCGADIITAQPAGQAAFVSASMAPAQLGATERCPHCGQEITVGARFCRHCGQTLLPAVKPTAPEPAPSAPPQLQVSPAPSHIAPGTIPKTMPLASVGVAQAVRSAQTSANPNLTLVAEAASPRRPRMSGRRFALPAWSWVLIGFLIGLLAGIGLLLAKPEVVNWVRAKQGAITVTPTSTAPTPVITSSATVTSSVIITPTLTSIMPTIQAASSAGMTPTVTVTATNVATPTIKSVKR